MIATQLHADLTAVKSRQQATWSSGDYAVIGTTGALSEISEVIALTARV
jgi:hypothetical protein